MSDILFIKVQSHQGVNWVQGFELVQVLLIIWFLDLWDNLYITNINLKKKSIAYECIQLIQIEGS